MDDEQKRKRAAQRQREYRERLKRDPERYAAAIARRRAAQKSSYMANRERYLQRQRAYVDRNRALVYARNREYSKKNREKIAARLHANYMRNLEANRERDRERMRLSYAKNPKAFNDYMKKWRAANPERARAYVRLSGHRRRAAAGGEFIKVEEWEELLTSYERRCAYCGVEAMLIEADHRIPLSRGGRNSIENIVPACRRCNRRKRTKTEEEFRAWLLARPKDSARETGRGTPDALAEVAGPYRTARSTVLPRGTARSRSRSRRRGRPGDRAPARGLRRC